MFEEPNERSSLARDYGWKDGTPLLILLAGALLTVGLTLPLLNVEKLLWDRDYSVAAGVFGLWNDRAWFLAAVVFFFSVVFPIAKLLLLAWIWYVPMDSTKRDGALDSLAALGKWSMLDVFIVAILVVAVKLGPLADVEPRAGVYWFGSAILCSMLATAAVSKRARTSDEVRARDVHGGG